MRPNANQHRLLSLVPAALLCVVGRAGAAPAAEPPAGRGELAARCDDLVRTARRSPLGWGWAAAAGREAAARDDSAKPPGGARPAAGPRTPPMIDGRETAVVGVQLLWAGELLAEPRYADAAREAARGLSVLQIPTGQVRSRGALARGAGGAKDALADVPDRGATIAALGLWLALLDAGKAANPRDEQLVRPAAAAARWLGSQQTPAGGWPVAYPPGGPVGSADRMVRLDTPDYRDASLALLLAGEVLGNRDLQLRFERAADQLLAMRVPCGNNTTPVLWSGAYDLQTQVFRKYPAFAPGAIDLLASRRALQVLLAGYLVTLKPQGSDAAGASAAAVVPLAKPEGFYRRFYSQQAVPVQPPPPGATDRRAAEPPRGLFPDPNEDANEARRTAAGLGIDEVLALTHDISEKGGVRVAGELARGRSLNRRLVEMICGLSDDSLTDRLSDDKPPTDASRSGASSELWTLLRRQIVQKREMSK